MGLEYADLDLPPKPGVYIFKRVDGRVTYIGKATDLRSRVRSYFSKNPDREMIPRLLDESENCLLYTSPSPRDRG